MALTLDQIVAEVREGLDEKLRLRGKTLKAQVAKAGRMLPRHVRRDAGYLISAQEFVAHPKLARQIDQRRLQAAHRRIMLHLETVDLAAERTTRLLGILASVAFAVLVTAGVVIYVLVQRGFL